MKYEIDKKYASLEYILSRFYMKLKSLNYIEIMFSQNWLGTITIYSKEYTSSYFISSLIWEVLNRNVLACAKLFCWFLCTAKIKSMSYIQVICCIMCLDWDSLLLKLSNVMWCKRTHCRLTRLRYLFLFELVCIKRKPLLSINLNQHCSSLTNSDFKNYCSLIVMVW